MSLSVSYMGTKRQLAALVGNMVQDCRPGPFLDAFAGMCSVGRAVAPSRQVWSNDPQHFANLVARAHFCSEKPRADAISLADSCREYFGEQRRALRKQFSDVIAREQAVHEAERAEALLDHFCASIEFGNSADASPTRKEHDLFARRFAGSYFSTQQAIDIDCIRYCLDMALVSSRISEDVYSWGLISLCVAIARSSTTTGHFAQPLAPKKSNFHRYMLQRRRFIWDEWLRATNELGAVGSVAWRKKNKAFRNDAIALLDDLRSLKRRPRVVYADPPYTKDQYSRYYHLYETVVLYDHPRAVGRGLYRDDRFASAFSQSSAVEAAIDDLISRCADLGSDLILSYPTNGLLPDSRRRIPELLARRYRKPVDAIEIPYIHSTMGGSKGAGRSDVTEVIYRVCS